MTRGEFARRVLEELSAPIKEHTRNALAAQMQTEGGSAKFNPFNTTLRLPGSTSLPGNTANVQQYLNAEQGIKATVMTLKEPGHDYEPIVRRLRKNAYATSICQAIIESDWGTGEAEGEDEPLILEVLDDIRHDRHPNTLAELEAKVIAH